MPKNILPDLQKQKFSREHMILVYKHRSYVMLDWPNPVYGPAFDAFGKSCVASYVIPVTPDNVPAGITELAVWPNTRSFELNEDPVAMLDPMSLTSPTDEK